MTPLLATRECLSIAPREFAAFARRYLMSGMKTIAAIRRDNLQLLIARYGSAAELNEKIGLARTDATLSQIKNQSPDSKTGAPKAMGDKIARNIEAALGLDEGWMDNIHYPEDHRHTRIHHALKIMEQMEDWQVDQAVKIIDTLAQPTPRNGTSNQEG